MEQLEQACELLSGKGKGERLKSLKVEMEQSAVKLDFEKAARLRDVIVNLERALSPTRQFTRGRGVPTTVKPTEDLAELGDWLSLSGPPTIMECFDISNISSTHIVASMVRFKNGLPDNQNYRQGYCLIILFAFHHLLDMLFIFNCSFQLLSFTCDSADS